MRNYRRNSFNLHDLSPHLFWDVDVNLLDPGKNFPFITKRVLEYGFLSDWIKFYRYFGLKKITDTVKELKSLDKKSLHFIAALSDSNLNDFKCYTTKPSTPPHWSF
jgi:hypothetical protein